MMMHCCLACLFICGVFLAFSSYSRFTIPMGCSCKKSRYVSWSDDAINNQCCTYTNVNRVKLCGHLVFTFQSQIFFTVFYQYIFKKSILDPKGLGCFIKTVIVLWSFVRILHLESNIFSLEIIMDFIGTF